MKVYKGSPLIHDYLFCDRCGNEIFHVWYEPGASAHYRCYIDDNKWAFEREGEYYCKECLNEIR